jgi:hypothetical protein
MYMTPQQVLAQYYQNQQQQQSLSPQGAMGGYGGAPVGNAPAPGAGSTGAVPAGLAPANYGMSSRFGIPIAPQVNALAQQMQANRALQRQIGYGGAPMQYQPQGGGGANIGGQQFGPDGRPLPMPQLQGIQQATQAMPMQPGAPVGMAGAAPAPMAGNAQQMPMQPMRQYNPSIGGQGGAANRLAQYYLR